MTTLTKTSPVIDAIPNVDDIRRQTTVGAVHSAQEMQRWKQKHMDDANQECNEKIQKAAKRGDASTKCDTWISNSYIAALQSKGYNIELVDTQADGEGGRLSSLDVLETPHYRVSWGDEK